MQGLDEDGGRPSPPLRSVPQEAGRGRAALAAEAAARIERSLELAADGVGDLTPLVYGPLFEARPELEAYFQRDLDGSIKGEMLARAFTVILDLIGERRFADQMIANEVMTHEGYDIQREAFFTFFPFVADGVRTALGGSWTLEFKAAWDALLEELGACMRAAPPPAPESDFNRRARLVFEAEFLKGRDRAVEDHGSDATPTHP